MDEFAEGFDQLPELIESKGDPSTGSSSPPACWSPSTPSSGSSLRTAVELIKLDIDTSR